MNEKTEKLRERIILAVNRQFSWDAWEDWGKYAAPKMAKEILKEMKEAGLVFAEVGVKGDDLEGACICRIEEIE